MDESSEELYDAMAGCRSCRLRSNCSGIVAAQGNLINPLLMICGDMPGQSDDDAGIPFSGDAGQLLRQTLRATGILNKTNTVLTNVLKCKPTGNKFPTDESAKVCVSLWLMREIECLKPKRLLLLGNAPLKFIAGLDKITSCRGQWYDARGIRAMATFHPSYIVRCDMSGNMSERKLFEKDIFAVAEEVEKLEKNAKTS